MKTWYQMVAEADVVAAMVASVVTLIVVLKTVLGVMSMVVVVGPTVVKSLFMGIEKVAEQLVLCVAYFDRSWLLVLLW